MVNFVTICGVVHLRSSCCMVQRVDEIFLDVLHQSDCSMERLHALSR